MTKELVRERLTILVDAWYFKTALAVVFAAFTAIAAQIRIPLPFTPVPITMQTAFVIGAGLALGWRWGLVSMLVYLMAGALGAPVFAGWSGGAQAFAGPTLGYLIGFPVAAMISGAIRGSWWKTALGTSLALATIYLFGVGYLIAGWGMSPVPALSAGCYPFLIGAALKWGLVNTADFSLRRLLKK